jgi:hypothetical protein
MAYNKANHEERLQWDPTKTTVRYKYYLQLLDIYFLEYNPLINPNN